VSGPNLDSEGFCEHRIPGGVGCHFCEAFKWDKTKNKAIKTQTNLGGIYKSQEEDRLYVVVRRLDTGYSHPVLAFSDRQLAEKYCKEHTNYKENFSYRVETISWGKEE
jgi:hypothetical protein